MPQQLRSNQIIVGDVYEELPRLPRQSIDTVITSPPYFGLRDYGHERQIGLESDVDAWVQNIVKVCEEIARVLKPTGSIWLNVGDRFSLHHRFGAPEKSLLLGPQRLALALAKQNWIIRNQVIWAKRNNMPTSVRDRLGCTHEVILLLVRSQQYFFDLDAIRVPAITPHRPRRAGRAEYPPPEAQPPKEYNINKNRGLNTLKTSGQQSHPLGKNPGDVWNVSPNGFRGAHFATFPMSLIERPLLATCPEKVCAGCGKPWQREPVDRTKAVPALGALQPGCACNDGTRPGIVLDPFIGSGTVALAAESHGREWIGIELNPAYAGMARERIAAARCPKA